jgi:predicted DNA binding protein
MEKVYVQIIAFDKNSNDNIGRSIVADNKESFNQQVEEFESEVPFTKFYIEMIADDVLTDKQLEIVEDHDVN